MQKIGTQTSLLRGQSHAAHFRRGEVIAIAAGSVRVISRITLEHDTLTVQTLVSRGGVFQAPCSGWLEIAADSDALIGLEQKPGGLVLVKRLWRSVVKICERFQPPAPVSSWQEATN
ncbi:hypothetical protein [Rhodoferax sp.]|uniref:hypothetical protein n=1 Tax=Rhodoferax sp. TaxID=50421 RepID=UPI00284859E6|nr:hypothetical protein [Rhodoferax sp.]MDR3371228.1 hypothetical protein [Rhodoferax sp.]